MVGEEADFEWADGNVLEVRGTLDQRTVVRLRRAVSESLERRLERGPKVILDLAGVSRADSASLSLMMHWMRRARAHGCALEVRGLPEQMRALARTSRMEEHLDG